jgi:16S rRNA (guanine1207-N2)-methyltransferase
MDTDVYFHKTVPFRAWKQALQFRTSQELFSSHDIDTGTKFLLRTIAEAGYNTLQCILDMGCGYGPLGLSLKSLQPDSSVHLIDRDALAVEYAQQNAAINFLEGTEIYGSLGYDDVKRNDFDLIVSNIPGKAGETVIAHLLREAQYFLKPGGLSAVVVVAPLEEFVTSILNNTPGIEVILKRNRSGHAVFHYRFNEQPRPAKPVQSALEHGIYHRNNITISTEKLEYPVQTAYGLPDFDSLSYGSEMLLDALGKIKNTGINYAAVINPGQGHIPVAVWKLFRPSNITLTDRDLLALRYSRLNLTLNDCPAESIDVLHQVGINFNPKEKADLITGILREEEGKDATFLTLDQATAKLSDKGVILLAAGSTAITRLIDYAEMQGILRIKSRERRRGYSLLVMEKAKPD